MKKFFASAAAAALVLALAPIAARADDFGTLLHATTPAASVADTDELYLLPLGVPGNAQRVLGSKFVRPGGPGGTPSSIDLTNATNVPGAQLLANSVSAAKLAFGAAASNLGFTPVPNTLTITAGTGLSGGGALSGNISLSVNTTQNITTLSNLTGNGLVKTSGGNGTLGIAVAKTDFAPATAGSANAPLLNDGLGGFTNGTRSGNTTIIATASGALTSGHIAAFDASGNIVDGGNPGGTGTVTSVGLSVPGGAVFSVTGSPITGAGTLALSAAGNSGGILYFPSASTIGSSAALTANNPVIGGGAGVAPSSGSRSGNTTVFGTTSGALTSGHIAAFDASGNIVDGGAAGAGSVTTTDGTTSLAATTISFDPASFSVTNSGSGVGTVKPITTVRTISTTSDTAIATDANKTLRMTNAGATTLGATAAATLGSGYGIYLECDGAGGCTFDPNGSETVDGALTLALVQGEKATLQTDGTGWRATVLSPLDPRNASNLNSGKVANAQGGAGTLTGVLKATSGVVSTATLSGAGTTLATTSGSLTTGNCVSISSGNLVDAGGPCTTGGGGGTVNSGTANQIAYYASTGTVVSGDSHVTDDGSTVSLTQAVAVPGSITPTALVTDANDYAPAGNSTAVRLRVDAGGADRLVTGVAGGAAGVVKVIYNAGATNNLTLKDENASSTAANRFHLGGNDITIAPGKARAFLYDATLSRWTNLDAAQGNTGVTAGSYTAANITVSADGRITTAANGAGGGAQTIQMSTGVGGTLSVNTFLGPPGTASTFFAARPWVADNNSVTIQDLTCVIGAVPGAGNTLAVAAWVAPGTAPTTPVDNSASQSVTISGASSFTSTTVNNTPITLNKYDMIGLKVTNGGGTFPTGSGLVCSFKRT